MTPAERKAAFRLVVEAARAESVERVLAALLVIEPDLRRMLPVSGSATRMRRHRERSKASPSPSQSASHVTPCDAQGDASGDAAAPSPLSHSPLSPEKISLNSSLISSSSGSESSSLERGSNLEERAAAEAESNWPRSGLALPVTFSPEALRSLDVWAFSAGLPTPSHEEALAFCSYWRSREESFPSLGAFLERFKTRLLDEKKRAAARRNVVGRIVQPGRPGVDWEATSETLDTVDLQRTGGT